MGFPLQPLAPGRHKGLGESGVAQSLRTSFSLRCAGGDLV